MRQLSDRFELLRWIGSGGMADVHLAVDRELERKVALKILRRDLLGDATAVARFRREALCLGMIDSPHVVGIHDVYIGPELAYLVLRHVPGLTLDAVIAAYGPLPPRRALRVIAGVIAGLRDLHAHRLVHRDLTPGNVIVDDTDRAVLLDLGVARDRRRRSLTPVDAAVGTPGFIAPELEQGAGVDARTDQYQVGLLMLLALTGVAPESGSEAIAAALETVASPLRAVISRALAPAPSDRFDDVGELGEALEGAVLAIEMRAKRPSPLPPMSEPMRALTRAPAPEPLPTPAPAPPVRRTVSLRARRRSPMIPIMIGAFIAGLTFGIALTLTLTLT